MINNILEILHNNGQILVFLSLALGYMLGKVKFFNFSLGATTGVLLVSIFIGQIGIDIPTILRDISFALFTFCIGYKVGPQFFGALKKEGVKYIIISLVVAFVALFGAIALGKMLSFDKGTTAGFFAGSVTESAAIGTAEGAINQLSISSAEKDKLNSNVAVAYAITYIFGTAGMLIFLKLVPKFWKINLKEESKKLEKEMSGGGEVEKPELFSWSKQVDLRAYKIANEKALGKSVSQIEALFPGRVARGG